MWKILFYAILSYAIYFAVLTYFIDKAFNKSIILTDK